MEPLLILINPWIYDFAAYDLWSKPLGLLYLASYLRRCGFRIRLLDCLDVHHPAMIPDARRKRPVRRDYGTGKFWRETVPRPAALEHIPRSYSRYGVSREAFIRDLSRIPRPDAILITSLMTYWYPGVREAAALARELHPEVPVILGGIYAALCPNHARQATGADRILQEAGLSALASVLEILDQCGLDPPERPDPSTISLFPAFDLLTGIDYVSLLTSSGCPYRCRYCASHLLNPRPLRRDPLDVFEEILFWHGKYGVRDFAFYDDALLIDWQRQLGPLLETVIDRGPHVRFHTPNALHVREIDRELAGLLYRSGFRTVRLGLETSDMDLHRDLDGKVAEGEFEGAAGSLLAAGFSSRDIGAYILAGLPGQSPDSVMDTIRFAASVGASPYLAEYSPIPHTALWEKARDHSAYDLLAEPLFHNNTLYPCWDEGQRARIPELKREVREARRAWN
ncbi:MAG: cobalamin-dependent protein [Deltaproteobacteria bacterium]|nr:cobalamin-dependent protein [Deltaproteobacteria bacterium]